MKVLTFQGLKPKSRKRKKFPSQLKKSWNLPFLREPFKLKRSKVMSPNKCYKLLNKKRKKKAKLLKLIPSQNKLNKMLRRKCKNKWKRWRIVRKYLNSKMLTLYLRSNQYQSFKEEKISLSLKVNKSKRYAWTRSSLKAFLMIQKTNRLLSLGNIYLLRLLRGLRKKKKIPSRRVISNQSSSKRMKSQY